jgi:hypothetical protein
LTKKRDIVRYRLRAAAILLSLAIDHLGLYPQNTGQSLPTIHDQAKPKELTVSIAEFGAVSDGSIGTPNFGHNNTSPVNAAIQAVCAAGGGKVLFPKGTFNIGIEPTAPRPDRGVAAITIPCSNITLQGAGSDDTVLSFWLISGGHFVVPTSVCPHNSDVVSAVKPRVWRGSGIYITGGRSADSATTNVTIRDLRLTGNAVINGNARNPVEWDGTEPLPPNSECNAWDTSNKGIYLQNNDFSHGANGVDSGGYYPPTATYFDSVRILNVHVDRFLGELVYEGNLAVANSEIRGSEFDHSNGDCISVAGGWQFLDNSCHDIAANAFENTPGSTPQVYSHNRMEDVALDGIAITDLSFGTKENLQFGNIRITGNTFRRVKRCGISLYDAWHVVIADNSIADSHTGIQLYDLGISTPAPAFRVTEPPAPVLLKQLRPSGSPAISAGQLFVSTAWHFGDGSAHYSDFSSRPSVESIAYLDGNAQVIVKAPNRPPSGSAPFPTGWEVFAGRSQLSETVQGSVLPLGTDFVISDEPGTTGPNRLLFEGAPAPPQIPPALSEESGGSIGLGSYDIATAWVASTMVGDVISGPSPRSNIQVHRDSSQITVTQPNNPPDNAKGYLVFAGLKGGPLTLVGNPNTLTQSNTTALVQSLPGEHHLALPGTSGIILSPNLHDIEISHNTILADEADVSAGIQCCGTPQVWPMFSGLTIRDNTFSATVAAKSAGYQVRKPINLTQEIADPAGIRSLDRHGAPVVQRLVVNGNIIQ